MTPEEKSALLEQLRMKHGHVYQAAGEDSEYGLIVFRRLSKLEYRQLKADRDDENLKLLVDEKYSAKVVVYPDAPTFQQLIDEYPLIAANVLAECFKVSGGGKLEGKAL